MLPRRGETRTEQNTKPLSVYLSPTGKIMAPVQRPVTCPTRTQPMRQCRIAFLFEQHKMKETKATEAAKKRLEKKERHRRVRRNPVDYSHWNRIQQFEAQFRKWVDSVIAIGARIIAQRKLQELGLPLPLAAPVTPDSDQGLELIPIPINDVAVPVQVEPEIDLIDAVESPGEEDPGQENLQASVDHVKEELPEGADGHDQDKPVSEPIQEASICDPDSVMADADPWSGYRAHKSTSSN